MGTDANVDIEPGTGAEGKKMETHIQKVKLMEGDFKGCWCDCDIKSVKAIGNSCTARKVVRKLSKKNGNCYRR